jgi:hypothetical protein
MCRGSAQSLDEAQRAELETLVAQGQRRNVRKAQAVALLTEWAHRVTIKALSAAHE